MVMCRMIVWDQVGWHNWDGMRRKPLLKSFSFCFMPAYALCV